MQETAADAKVAIQEMAEYSQKWHNGTSRGRSTETSDGLAAIQAQLNNLGREIKKVNENVYADQANEQVLQEEDLGKPKSSTETNPRDQVNVDFLLLLKFESHTNTPIRSPQYAVIRGKRSVLAGVQVKTKRFLFQVVL
ncbi:hypothetical protein Tco_0356360 [Tanacetum coccineum]